MKLDRVKRLAAHVLRIGQTKVWFDPNTDNQQKIKEAISKEDVKLLIQEGVIVKRKDNFHSRGAARILKEKKKKGRKRGKGKRTGTKKARIGKKTTWIKNVRAQRKMLKTLKEENPDLFKKVSYSSIYKRIQGGYYKGKKYVEAAVKEAK